MKFNPMTSKGFLSIGGILLILLAVLGFVLPGGAVLGDLLWFSTAENVAHLVLGVTALAALYIIPANLHKPLIILVGVIALFFGLYGFILPQNMVGKGFNTFGVANLESPLENLVHVIVGAWALYVAFMAKGEAMAKT